MLKCLPNLKHISLRMGPKYGILPDDYFGRARASGCLGICEVNYVHCKYIFI